MTEPKRVTKLLIRWGEGDHEAQEELLPIVYEELRRMAKGYMRGENSGHTFQTTELIHEAYLKMSASEDPDWKNRNHFFGVAANAMRQILVDYARGKARKKRGGSPHRIDLEMTALLSADHSSKIVALDEALKELAQFDERKSKVVELKFFGGMKIEEMSELLEVSPITIKRDWKFARAWLLNKLKAG